MTNGPILEVCDLKKTIKGKPIIKGVSFDVQRGEVFGFLGPNGSGKTTTIRMLVSLIRPTAGHIYIDGKNLLTNHKDALSQIGCIVENPELYPYLSGYENLNLFAGMLKDVDDSRIKEVVEIVGLGQRIHDRVKTYSLGMRQRLGIAQALLGRPKLLILDEPTNGLDPQGIKEMRVFIRNLAKNGISVFVSSHLLSEIQLLCDRVAIIRSGEVIAVGNVEQLLLSAGGYTEWYTNNNECTLTFLKSQESVQIIEREVDEAHQDIPGERICTIHASVLTPNLISSLTDQGVQIYAVQYKNPTLEDLFLRLTGGDQIE